MFKILENKMIVPNLHQLTVLAPEVARAAQAGNFAILRVEDDGERIPLSLCDWNREQGSLTFVYMNVGATTGKLAALKAGSEIPSVVGPLGNGMPIENYGSVLLIGGCYGIASLYPVARALKAKGNTVTTLIEGRSQNLLYWQEKHRKVVDQLIILTRDGSLGTRGHVGMLPGIIASLARPVDLIITNGCNYLMMRTCQESQPMNLRTIVSLNTLMIDGTGMCGVCRVSIDGETRFACVDGPHFDGHKVDWDELAQRRVAYLCEENIPLRSSAPTLEPN
jgi:ferredoxin--NADP+ reductase